MSWTSDFYSVLLQAGGTQLAAGKSIIDALGSDGTTITDVGLYAGMKDLIVDDAASISNKLGAFDGGADEEGNVKDALGVSIATGSVTAQIAIVDTNVDAIKAKTDNLPADTTARFTSIDSAISGLNNLSASQAADAVWDEDLSPAHITVGSAGKALLDIETYTDILDDATNGNAAIKTAIDSIYSAVQGIQNNTRMTSGIPSAVEIPETGSIYTKFFINLFDSNGNKEDPDSNDIAVILTQADGTNVTAARLFQDGDGTDTALAASTEFVGPKKLVQDSAGRYYAFYKSNTAHVEEVLNFQFKYKEVGVEGGRDVAMEVLDDLGNIETDIAAIKAKTDNLPANTATVLSGIVSDIAALNDISTAQVNTEVDTALADINLDHLAKNAVVSNADMTAELSDGTILSNILTTAGDTSTFNPATMSLQALASAIAAVGTASTVKTPDPISVSVTTSETTLWDKRVAGHVYKLEHFRVKSAAISAPNTMAIKLYEEINNVEVLVNTFTIATQQTGVYHSLMDMFGLDNIQGHIIKLTATMSGGSAVAATGQANWSDFVV